MALAGIHTSILITEEITEDSSKREKESSKLDLSPVRGSLGKGLFILRADPFIISAMELVETATSCKFLSQSSSDEGGIAKSGNKFNYLKFLRAPIETNNKKNDSFNSTQGSWRKRNTSQSFYQKNLNHRLSTPREYEDPYKQLRSTFASSMRTPSLVR